jgi:hypothetical protein
MGLVGSKFCDTYEKRKGCKAAVYTERQGSFHFDTQTSTLIFRFDTNQQNKMKRIKFLSIKSSGNEIVINVLYQGAVHADLSP